MGEIVAAPAFDMAALMAEMARMNAERDAETCVKRAELLEILREARIDRVEAEYDACGDSGNIESVTLLRKITTPGAEASSDATDIAAENHFQPVDQAVSGDQITSLQDLLWAIAYRLHPGFENNDGAYGEIGWDLEADLINVEHNERFTDVNSYSHEGI